MIRTLEGHANWVAAVALLPDGRRALSGSWDNTLKLWDLEHGNCCATWTADQPIRCVAAVSDRFFLAGDEDGSLHFLDLV
jgi:WD40 repeat protein